MPDHTEESALTPALVAGAFRLACRFDVLSFKPGNVSIRAAGHRMQARDFLISSKVAARSVVHAEGGLGQAIYQAVAATQAAVGCNTNLGILLLGVPLAHAALRASGARDLAARTRAVLASATRGDAVHAFAAIRLANPAGLGQVAAHDVAIEPSLTLTAAMRLAAERDSIAAQYATGFDAIFTEGLPLLRRQRAERGRLSGAVTACYLHFLSTRPDSHIARKFGAASAARISARALIVTSLLEACEDPRRRLSILRAFDSELKDEGVNPGTSADLTVASLLALLLDAPLRRLLDR